eukprot:scaffold7242_cov400-Prasinococcus_capsulatus_cf.AAC.16
MAVLRMVQQQRKQAAADSTRLAAGDELEKAVQDVHRILADIYMHPPAQPVLAVEHFARAGVPQAHAGALLCAPRTAFRPKRSLQLTPWRG